MLPERLNTPMGELRGDDYEHLTPFWKLQADKVDRTLKTNDCVICWDQETPGKLVVHLGPRSFYRLPCPCGLPVVPGRAGDGWPP